MKKLMLLFVIFFLFNCEEEKGKKLPFGDEFEDIWVKIGDGYVKSLCPSNLKEGEFFIYSYGEIKRIENGKIGNVLYSAGYHEITNLSSSFYFPERLIFGLKYTYTDSSYVFILNTETLDTQLIIVPYLSYPSFVSFSPKDPDVFFIGNNHTVLRSSDAGVFSDTVFVSSDSIIDFKAFKNGRIYILTVNEIFLSEDGGNTWKSIFSSPEIKGMVVDEEEDMYILFKDKILRIYPGGEKVIPLPYQLSCKYAFIETRKGVFLAIMKEGIRVFKMLREGEFIELSFSLLYTVDVTCDEFSSILFARNDDEYILVLDGYDYLWFGGSENGNIFYLYDSPLPP